MQFSESLLPEHRGAGGDAEEGRSFARTKGEISEKKLERRSGNCLRKTLPEEEKRKRNSFQEKPKKNAKRKMHLRNLVRLLVSIGRKG